MNRTIRSLGKHPARTYFRLKYLWESYWSSPTHNFPLHQPLRLWWVSPRDVEMMMKPGYELSREYYPGVVLNGDWDQVIKPFKESIYYKSFKRRFVYDEPWDETPLYESALNRDPENYWHGCSTEAEINAKLAEYTDVYHSIVENGYLTQRELQNRGMMTQTLVPPEKKEVRINVDRDGNVIFEEGRHRFSIAMVLDLERIPVIVMGRHKQWVENGGTLDDVAALSSQR